METGKVLPTILITIAIFVFGGVGIYLLSPEKHNSQNPVIATSQPMQAMSQTAEPLPYSAPSQIGDEDCIYIEDFSIMSLEDIFMLCCIEELDLPEPAVVGGIPLCATDIKCDTAN